MQKLLLREKDPLLYRSPTCMQRKETAVSKAPATMPMVASIYAWTYESCLTLHISAVIDVLQSMHMLQAPGESGVQTVAEDQQAGNARLWMMFPSELNYS